jgi:DNA-nicking Smr family endonuclease
MAGDKKSEENIRIFEEAMVRTNTSKRDYPQQRIDQYKQKKKPATGINPKRYFSTEPVEPAALDNTDQGEFVLFYRTGLQRKVIRKLKRGEYPLQAELDLHGMTTRQADEALSDFLSDAIQHNLSCILIIHGKGYHSDNKKGVLKPYAIDWLKKSPVINAFCSALPRDGDTGAVYVLLGKAKFLPR